MSEPAAIARYLDAMKVMLTGAAYDESAYEQIAAYPSRKRRSLHAAVRAWARHAVVRYVQSRGYIVYRRRKFNLQARMEGKDWPSIAYTMAGFKRLDNLVECSRVILDENIPGDFVETGVWRGGASIFMKCILTAFGDESRVVWLADSFEGMPVPRPGLYPEDAASPDLSSTGYLSVSIEQVKANFERFGMLDDRVRFLKGWFKDTLPASPIESVSLLRLDGDLYESTMDALEALYPRVTLGGFVVVDDYGSWQGCRRAVDEYRCRCKIDSPLVPIDGHAVYWRVSAGAM